MRPYEVKDSLQRTLSKLAKKDRNSYEQILKKMQEIINSVDVEHYKNLRTPMQELKRVHIRRSFVLVFKYIKTEDTVIFWDFDHHDNIYK